MNQIFAAIIQRDLQLAFRQGGGLGAALGFVLAVLVMVPLSLGPELNLLQRLAPGLMWLTILLSVLLTAERIFSNDLEDGSLEFFVAEQIPLVLVVLAKTLAHWLMVSFPLAVFVPLLALMLNLDTPQLPVLMAAMLIGSIAMSLLASIGGAIAAGLKRGGLLITLLILPLYVPILVFGVAASNGAATPAGAGPSLMVLTGLTLATLVLAPWAAAAALRAYLK
jgi:heme exporter protein B